MMDLRGATRRAAASLPGPGAEFEERSACPACEGRELRTVYAAPYAGSEVGRFLERYYAGRIEPERIADSSYVVERCRACGTAFQRFIPRPQLLDEIYDRWLNQTGHPDEDPEVARALARPAQSRDGHELFAVAAALNEPVESLAVLDYGMGWGLWARVARRLGCRAHGFDLSEERRRFVAEDGVQILLPGEFRGANLDFINTEQVIEHLPDPRAVVEELASALRPGGLLKIAVPKAPLLELRFLEPQWDVGRADPRSLNAVHPFEHLNCFTSRGLASLAEAAGLSRFPVSWRAYGAFARHSGSLDLGSPRRLAKSLLRPAYHKLSTWQTYHWYQAPT